MVDADRGIEEAIRRRLLRERAVAEGRITELTAHAEKLSAEAVTEGRDDEHDPDGATAAFEYGMSEGMLELAVAKIAAVDAAIGRLEGGEYGFSAACHRPIQPERLAVHPTALTCVRCASGADAEARRPGLRTRG